MKITMIDALALYNSTLRGVHSLRVPPLADDQVTVCFPHYLEASHLMTRAAREGDDPASVLTLQKSRRQERRVFDLERAGQLLDLIGFLRNSRLAVHDVDHPDRIRLYGLLEGRWFCLVLRPLSAREFAPVTAYFPPTPRYLKDLRHGRRVEKLPAAPRPILPPSTPGLPPLPSMPISPKRPAVPAPLKLVIPARRLAK